MIGELTEALGRAKTLAGLFPICACCKRIRDDQGYWQQVEAYISGSDSDAVFTQWHLPGVLQGSQGGIEKFQGRSGLRACLRARREACNGWVNGKTCAPFFPAWKAIADVR